MRLSARRPELWRRSLPCDTAGPAWQGALSSPPPSNDSPLTAPSPAPRPVPPLPRAHRSRPRHGLVAIRRRPYRVRWRGRARSHYSGRRHGLDRGLGRRQRGGGAGPRAHAQVCGPREEGGTRQVAPYRGWDPRECEYRGQDLGRRGSAVRVHE
jgi:hypothetical protein